MLDRFQLSHYRTALERDFLKFGSTEFQGWFGRLMSMAFVDDYINVRISKGDGGIDGFRLSTATAFQVYGPRVGSDSATRIKIRDDFATAKATLAEHGAMMKGWVFAHNDPHDLAHEVALTIAALQRENPGITIRRWAFDAIWDIVKELSLDRLEVLFGFTSPTSSAMGHLEFTALVPIISYLERAPIPLTADLARPSAKKLDYNALSLERRTIIETGNIKSGLVSEYLNGIPDPLAGEQIAEAFRERYRSLRGAGMPPDRVFDALWDAGGGAHFTKPLQIAAVSAIARQFLAIVEFDHFIEFFQRIS